MKKSKDVPEEAQGADYWENEIAYFENAMEGLKTSYAILGGMKKYAESHLEELLPSREEVES